MPHSIHHKLHCDHKIVPRGRLLLFFFLRKFRSLPFSLSFRKRTKTKCPITKSLFPPPRIWDFHACLRFPEQVFPSFSFSSGALIDLSAQGEIEEGKKKFRRCYSHTWCGGGFFLPFPGNERGKNLHHNRSFSEAEEKGKHNNGFLSLVFFPLKKREKEVFIIREIRSNFAALKALQVRW